MEKIKITFLGTGSAIPTEKRNHPAVLLTYKDENILFDCGEGTQRQFRYAKLNPCKLTKIFLTHWHADHVLGLPGLIQTLMLNGYSKTLKIYGPKNTKKFMEKYLELFAKKANKLKIEIHEISNNKPVDEKEFYIETQEMSHDSPCLAYSFILKSQTRLDKTKLKKLKLPNTPLLGELVKGKKVKIEGKTIDGKKLIYTEPERKITYIMDTRQNKNTAQLAKNSDILICESTYAEDEKEIADEHAHLTSTQAAEIAKQSKSKTLYLTHLSQRYETKNQQKQILDQAKKVFKNSEIAKDLLSIEL